MTDITIPPEALEAAAESSFYEEYGDGSGTWEEAPEWLRVTIREQARVACLAMLKAWQTEKHKMIVGVAIDEVGGQYPAIILPLPPEEGEK